MRLLDVIYEAIVTDRLPDNFHKLPVGTNNYRSAQLNKDTFTTVVKKFKIKNIVRLNPEGNVSPSEEQSLCDANGIKFYFNPTQDVVNKLLDGGNTLVHCLYGRDRTGGFVGAYLYSKGWDTKKIWDYTIQYNQWVNELLGKVRCVDGDCWADAPAGRHLKLAQKFGVKSKKQALSYIKQQ